MTVSAGIIATGGEGFVRMTIAMLSSLLTTLPNGSKLFLFRHKVPRR